MAHFAEINDNNIVTNVIVVADEHEADGENWCNELLGGTWKQTSYNTQHGKHYAPNSDTEDGTQFRKNYAGTGYTYDITRDAFIPPQPFPSWTLNEDTCQWQSPVAYPDDGKIYEWDEDTTNWVEITL